MFFFTPVFFGNFAFHNDYRIWEYNHTNFWFGYPESKHLFIIGRPLGMLLLNLQLLPIQTMHGVWISQSLNVVILGFLAVSCFYFFQKYIRIHIFCAAILAILLISLPSMTINAIWITNLVPCIIPLFLTIIAQIILQRPHPSYKLAGVLLFLSLLIYPPATLFFTTLTFSKFIFAPIDTTQNNLKKIINEVILIIVVCIIYFIFLKILKSLLLATNFAGIDWSTAYGHVYKQLPQYKLNFNLHSLDKLIQIKNYLIFVFSAWFPLFSWPIILGIMSGFLVCIIYAIQSNTYLHTYKNPTKTFIGIGVVLSLISITALPLLSGPAVYQINYRVSFATMAIVPIVLVFIINQILLKYKKSKWLIILINISLSCFVIIEACSQFRLAHVVNRSTEEYTKIRSNIAIQMHNNIKIINIERPVVLEDPIWLNADFGLDASSYMITGQIKEILSSLHKDFNKYKINYGSEFSPNSEAILIPKANVIINSPNINIKDILGTWYYFGNPTNIQYKQQKLWITNESKISTTLTIKNNKLLYVADWNCAAKLSQDKQKLHWDNGTTWARTKI